MLIAREAVHNISNRFLNRKMQIERYDHFTFGLSIGFWYDVMEIA